MMDGKEKSSEKYIFTATIGEIRVEIEKKRIKNMYLRILPPDGRVKITAPLRTKEEAICRFVTSKKEWIMLHQDRLKENQAKHDCSPDPEYVTGETVLLWGKAYPLAVEYSSPQNGVRLYRDTAILMVRKEDKDSTRKERYDILKLWYREALSRIIPKYMTEWEDIINVKADSWYIRDMKTRWGTCNVSTKRICLNLQLVKKDPVYLEYVIVHELVHLKEKSHNHVFKAYMDQYLPNWRKLRSRLRA